MIKKILGERRSTKGVFGLGASISDMETIKQLFDPNFYRARHPDVLGDDSELAEHYLTLGWRLGFDPSKDFSTKMYLKSNVDVHEKDMNPLLHFLRYGRSEGRQAHPAIVAGAVAVARKHDAVTGDRYPDAESIEALFDKLFYSKAFSKGSEPLDPVSHYLDIGWKEGRNPAPWFSNWHYLALNQDVADHGMNPFLHYCLAGRSENREMMQLGRDDAQRLYAAHEEAVNPGAHFEEFDPNIGVGRKKKAKVLAYYLPQFHAVEVNDKNWGKGFTEWRNLPRALPRFFGHIQPKIPRDLGSYNLSDGATLRRQVELAKAAGLHGFCFYYYSFDGQRILETPTEQMLLDQSLDFPFCLMWTNENWTRTWDGADSEVILKQSYDPERDNDLVDDLARHMKDVRYIHIDGRPIVFIYRPGHVPEASATIHRWRTIFEERHGLSPLIFMAQGFGDLDPEIYGLDGAIEFPPHKLAQDLPPINNTLDLFDTNYKGHVFSYDSLIQRSLSEPQPGIQLIKTAIPNWDNEARRPGRGMIIHGSTPQKFEYWLNQLCTYAEENKVYGESIVCINAWNEWAEGAVLEPDVHYGGSYLNALSRAVHGVPQKAESYQNKVVLIGHDANLNGAQMLALNLGRTLKENFGFEVVYILGGDGPLRIQYEEVGRVFLSKAGFSDIGETLSLLGDEGYSIAITNTTASGSAVPVLKNNGFKVLSLIHELPNLLHSFQLELSADAIAQNSDHVIFPAQIVWDGFEAFAGKVAKNGCVFPQGLYNKEVMQLDKADGGLREELGLASNVKIVLGIGYADIRKGIDRFVSAGISLAREQKDIAFLWVGAPAAETLSWFQPEIEASGLRDRVRIMGHRHDVGRFLAAADAFYLSSREDPFPSVVLEALACGLPVVGHRGCGGCDDLIERHGILVSESDPLAAVRALKKALRKPSAKVAKERRDEITQNYDFASYVFGLAKCLKPDLASVSAIIPNYNYERYLGQRLRSVFDQTYSLREVIVLDDASSDASVSEINRTAHAAHRQIDLVVNEYNSGSPFPQWYKGASLAKGDYVWIAEADDIAEPTFVAKLIDRMQSAGSVLGFTDSCQIDEEGGSLGNSYRPYIDEIESGAFDEPFDMEGPEFLARFLAVKNVILNVSGVIFHRQTLLDAFAAVGDELQNYSVAGDWRLYAEICSKPGNRLTWLPEPLNTHRRHSVSVTHALKVEKHLAEIDEMHRLVGSRIILESTTLKRQFLHFEACRVHLKI